MLSLPSPRWSGLVLTKEKRCLTEEKTRAAVGSDVLYLSEGNRHVPKQSYSRYSTCEPRNRSQYSTRIHTAPMVDFCSKIQSIQPVYTYKYLIIFTTYRNWIIGQIYSAHLGEELACFFLTREGKYLLNGEGGGLGYLCLPPENLSGFLSLARIWG